MHLWWIWLDLLSLLFYYFKWNIYAFDSLMLEYILKQPITSQFWLLYTYWIHISVMLQFQSPLCVNLQVWLAILWVKLFYHLGSISTRINILGYLIERITCTTIKHKRQETQRIFLRETIKEKNPTNSSEIESTPK